MNNSKIASGFGKQLERVYPTLEAWRNDNNNSTIVLNKVLENVNLSNEEGAGRCVADSLAEAFRYFEAREIKPTNELLIGRIIESFEFGG